MMQAIKRAGGKIELHLPVLFYGTFVYFLLEFTNNLHKYFSIFSSLFDLVTVSNYHTCIRD